MSAQTKIFVLRFKELIYTGIFVGLGVLLVILFLFMFSGNRKEPPAANASTYIPGVYRASVMLGGNATDVEITVNGEEISSVRFVKLEDTLSAMYPLAEPALEEIKAQLTAGCPINDIAVSEQMKYTQTVLIQAMKTALNKAAAQ